MKKLGGLALLLLLASGVWVNSLRPAPNVKAREALGNLIEIERAPPYVTPQQVHFYDIGAGPCVVLFPSAGREASDFNELSEIMATNGYRVISVEAGGINNSSLSLAENFYESAFSIHMANALICDTNSTVLIGHAFGNRIVRYHANLSKMQDGFDVSFLHRPTETKNVKGVILLAAGGQVTPDPEADAALKRIFNPLKSYHSRMKDVQYAFFAEGNEIPPHWKRGWHTKTAIAQGKAKGDGDDSWHCAGGVPMLIVQPMQDKIAPPENAYALRDKCPQEVEIVEVENAGHALLPEQPEAVAEAVLAFLAKHHPIETSETE